MLIPRLPDEVAPPPREEPPREEPPLEAATADAASSIVAYVIAGVMASVFLMVVVGAVLGSSRSHAHAGTSARGGGASSESVTIDSCRCAFGDGQTTPEVTIDLLAPPSDDPSRAYQIEIQTRDNVAHTRSTRTLAAPGGSALAGSLPQTLGVACGPGVYVLVAGGVATAWSSVTGAHKWTTALASPMATIVAPAGATRTASTAFASRCTPLEEENGRVTIPLAGGSTTSLSLRYGTTR